MYQQWCGDVLCVRLENFTPHWAKISEKVFQRKNIRHWCRFGSNKVGVWLPVRRRNL